jgi:hypothetical protein
MAQEGKKMDRDELGIWLTLESGLKRKFLKSAIWSYGALPNPKHPLFTAPEDGSPPIFVRPKTVNSYIVASTPNEIEVCETIEDLNKMLGW